MASWEEARRCPADQSPGQIVGQQILGRDSGASGSKLITLQCKNTRCQYHTDSYIVQIRPDGTIPDPVEPSQREKFFPTHAPSQRARDVVAQLQEQVARETKPGAEVRGFR